MEQKKKYKGIINIEIIDSLTQEVNYMAPIEMHTYAISEDVAKRNMLYHLGKETLHVQGVCEGVFRKDTGTLYKVEIEVSEEVEEKQSGRGKDKKPRHRRTNEEIRKAQLCKRQLYLEPRLSKALDMKLNLLGVTEEKYISDMLSKDLEDILEIINKYEEV